jgi:hypothetical protein
MVLYVALPTNQGKKLLFERKTSQIDHEIVKFHRLPELERPSGVLRVKNLCLLP